MSTVVCDTRVRHQQTGGVTGGMAVEIARTTTTTVRVTVSPCSATGVAGTSVGMGEGAFGRYGGTVGSGVWVTVQCNTSTSPNTSFYITHRMELTPDKRFTILSQSHPSYPMPTPSLSPLPCLPESVLAHIGTYLGSWPLYIAHRQRLSHHIQVLQVFDSDWWQEWETRVRWLPWRLRHPLHPPHPPPHSSPPTSSMIHPIVHTGCDSCCPLTVLHECLGRLTNVTRMPSLVRHAYETCDTVRRWIEEIMDGLEQCVHRSPEAMELCRRIHECRRKVDRLKTEADVSRRVVWE